jgi:hypothetical protein
MAQEGFIIPGREDDPVLQSIGYFFKAGNYFDLIWLKARMLDRSQLQQVAPIMRNILYDYQHRKHYSEVSQDVIKDYGVIGLQEKRHEMDRMNFGLVLDYFINAAKVIGPEKIEHAFRKKPEEYSREEISYSWSVARLMQFLSKVDVRDKLNQNDIEFITTSLDATDKLLEELAKV